MKKTILLTSVLIGLIGCSTKDITSDNIERQAILIETATATEQTINETVELLGQTVPNTQIPLFTPSLLNVEEVHKQLGDNVRAGEKIITLNNETASRQLEQAKKAVTELQKAISQAKQLNTAIEQGAVQLKTLQEELEDTLRKTEETLLSLGEADEGEVNVSITQFIQSSLELSLKQAEITQAAGTLQLQTPINIRELENQLLLAQENVRQAELALKATTITSPINGTVSELHVTKNQLASPSVPLVTIIDLETIQATFAASSFQIGNITKGQEALIYIDGIADPFLSHVETVSPVIQAQTNAFPIQIPINNENKKIKGGVKSTALIQTGKIEDAVVIPISSVLYEDTQPYVYIVSGTTVSRKDIILGNRAEQLIQVIEGVKKGDVVVTIGKERLTEGAEISIRNE